MTMNSEQAVHVANRVVEIMVSGHQTNLAQQANAVNLYVASAFEGDSHACARGWKACPAWAAVRVDDRLIELDVSPEATDKVLLVWLMRNYIPADVYSELRFSQMIELHKIRAHARMPDLAREAVDQDLSAAELRARVARLKGHNLLSSFLRGVHSGNNMGKFFNESPHITGADVQQMTSPDVASARVNAGPAAQWAAYTAYLATTSGYPLTSVEAEAAAEAYNEGN